MTEDVFFHFSGPFCRVSVGSIRRRCTTAANSRRSCDRACVQNRCKHVVFVPFPLKIARRRAIYSAVHLSRGPVAWWERGDGALEDTVTQMTEPE